MKNYNPTFIELFLYGISVRDTLYALSHWTHTTIQWIRCYFILILRKKSLIKDLDLNQSKMTPVMYIQPHIILHSPELDVWKKKIFFQATFERPWLCRAHATCTAVFLGSLICKWSITKFIFCCPGSFSGGWGMHNLSCLGQVVHACWRFHPPDQQEKDILHRLISSWGITTI